MMRASAEFDGLRLARQHARDAAELKRQSGSVARCSAALRVALTTLHDKMRKYGLN